MVLQDEESGVTGKIPETEESKYIDIISILVMTPYLRENVVSTSV